MIELVMLGIKLKLDRVKFQKILRMIVKLHERGERETAGVCVWGSALSQANKASLFVCNIYVRDHPTK